MLAILKQLRALQKKNEDYCFLLGDKSLDVSFKEKMSVFLRYVDRRGFVMVTLLEIIHVKNSAYISKRSNCQFTFLTFLESIICAWKNL